MNKTPQSKDCPNPDPEKEGVPQKIRFRGGALMALAAVGIFFGLLEGGLALFGIQPLLQEEDPFVGFAGNVPLFEERTFADGRTILATAPGKLTFFNSQQFPKEKGADTFRIFCLGGSTTFGRPYNDLTSFSGWLRELLPAADDTRHWEVVNAGGISYASYRVARLMEELARYQPDLFIVYTGHNEFLEERTYGALRDIPEIVRSTVGVLSRTRTWSAMSSALEDFGLVPESAQPRRMELNAEVDAILDQSAGLQMYRRDDGLRDGILEHYRLSLERMAGIAREAGAQIIFVTPASNLKDCSPFKSEHTDGLDQAGRKRVEALLATAESRMRASDWPEALADLDEAIAVDPRYAELHFRRGAVLFAMGLFDEALSAFRRARDEDVCPLRALTPMSRIVAEVAREQGVPLVDYADLVERQVLARAGYRIAGEESFLDHVHPTVEGHRMLAVALVESLVGRGIVRPGGDWPEGAVAAAKASVEERIDPRLQAKGLLNLAKVLSWARKDEDAARSARQALAVAKDYPQLSAEAGEVLFKLANHASSAEMAERYIREALSADPWNPRTHLMLGMQLLKQKRGKEGAAHILLSAAFQKGSPQANSLLGQVLFENRFFEQGYPYLRKALRLSPGDGVTRMALSQLRKRLGAGADALPLSPIVVRRDPSQVPREVFLTDPDAAGRGLPEGIFTEWFEDGSLKRYAEYERGVLQGIDLKWSPGRRLLSRAIYRNGIRVEHRVPPYPDS